MARETHKAQLIGVGGERVGAEFLLASTGNKCVLTLRFLEREIRAAERDYFEALCRIREQLEVYHLRPFCYGASRNVFPSGMGRDMGSGLVAYKLRMGLQRKPEDMVSIFDSGADVDPVSVEEQRSFFESWISSRR